MPANGNRKSTGSNFGCTFQLSAFHIFRALPFLFPIIQRRHGDFRLRPAKRDYGGTGPRVSSRHDAGLGIVPQRRPLADARDFAFHMQNQGRAVIWS